MKSNNCSRVLVTGATGFVGRHLCQHLLAQGFLVTAVGRTDFLLQHENLRYHAIESIDGNSNWQALLEQVDIIVHLAARAHHLKEKGMQALQHYQETNVKGTQQLARAAIQANVKRFVLVSTIKVIGEQTFDMALRAEDQPRPQDAYSLSKLQAEQILQEESRRSGMEWVIIRPPLVYGAGVKGNFRKLLSLSKTHFPLPFSAIRNRRSLVSVDNLCSFIECCISHPHAAGEVFLVSDNQDVSTAQLVRLLRKAQGKRGCLFPFPSSFLKLFGVLTGKRHQVKRMVDSLQLNIEKSSRLLNWQPPKSMEDSIESLYEQEREKEKER